MRQYGRVAKRFKNPGVSKVKWFKHDTDALLSEGVDALIDAEGFAGYGRWNRILEIVAFKMDETDRCHVEYSIQKWCRLLGLKQKKLTLFLELIKNEMKTNVVYYENIIRIEIPNLLEKRDNYTKHLQAAITVTSSQEVEVDREVEVEEEIETVVTQHDISFGEFWEIAPARNSKKIGKTEAIKKFYKLKAGDLANVIVAVHNYAESEMVKKGIGIKDPHRFLSNRENPEYWKEWIEAEVVAEPEDNEGLERDPNRFKGGAH